MSITVWHNPRCSKSRQTLALLEEKGISPTVRLYLEDSPTAQEIIDVLALLGMDDPRALMRTGEVDYKDQNLKHVVGQALITAMAETPKLIERPIVIKQDMINGDKAAVGRPPEAVLAIL